MSHSKKAGQLLIMSVVILGGILLSATAVAGLLLRYQLRLTNDVANSAKALFAADSLLEWHSYCAQRQKGIIGVAGGNPGRINQLNNDGIDCTDAGLPPTYLDSQVTSTSTIRFSNGIDPNSVDARIFSEGFGGKATRAVETILPF